ncbi:hypothetical protein ACFX13_036661 [Malus domestica]
MTGASPYIQCITPTKKQEILKEINDTASSELAAGGGHDEVKEMVYTHVALCESMRLYPPVPVDSKQAEHVAAISCSGHGRAYLDGLIS